MQNSSFLLPKNIGKIATSGVPSRAAHQRPVILDLQDINRAILPDITSSAPIKNILTIYRHTFVIWEYTLPAVQTQFEKGSRSTTKLNTVESSEDDEERSIRRTRKSISDIVKSNIFELFCTFTFDPKKVDRENPAVVKTKMQTWLKHQKRHSPNLAYLLIGEFHKDGKSLHFHVLLMNFNGRLKLAANDKGANRTFNIVGFQLGHTTAIKIDNNHDKVELYLKKYITKDMLRLSNQHRYWATRNLNKPTRLFNISEKFRDLHPKWQIALPQGVYRIYDIAELTSLGLEVPKWN